MYYIYIIESEIDSSLYIGYTRHLEQRLVKHNTSSSGYTSRKKPWVLRYTEEFDNKTDALIRERFLKRQKNREFYNKLFNNWSGSSVG